jgi:hypothetical protein
VWPVYGKGRTSALVTEFFRSDTTTIGVPVLKRLDDLETVNLTGHGYSRTEDHRFWFYGDDQIA